MIPGFNVQLKMREIKTRAGQYRQEVTLQGLTQIQAYDGHQAWQVQPFQGRKDPALMSADEAKGLALAADIDLPFVDYRRKGHSVEYARAREHRRHAGAQAARAPEMGR